MKRNWILNILMVLLVFVMIGGAVMYAGSLKGWFDKDEDIPSAVITPGVGASSIVRGGVGFSLSDETNLRDGDAVKTAAMSTLSIKSGNTKLILGADSSLSVESAVEDHFISDLSSGEMFLELNGSEAFALTIEEMGISLKDGVYHISAQTGAVTVSVFSGEAVYAPGEASASVFRTASASLSDSSSSVYTAKAGEALSILPDEVQTVPLQITSLNEFTIENAKKADEELCFSDAELDKVVEDREEEKRLALEALAKHEEKIKAQGGTEAVTAPVQVIGGGGSSGGPSKSCTIQILCYTILDNMGNLTPGKDAYVPGNGVILSTTRVSFNEGDTVFDVLKSVCNYAGIQIDYSWTPMYNSYYVKGINYLYEFDCGPESGWMYKVNGWFPNYGSSSYKLKDGDTIVWTYTCNGLGADVGGSVY